MTMVFSAIDGRPYDNAVVRYFDAGNRRVFDRLTSQMRSYDQIVALGGQAEIGPRPAALNGNFDFAGEGSTPPLAAAITGVGTTTITIVISGGSSNVEAPYTASFTLPPAGVFATPRVVVPAGSSSAAAAALLTAAIDALGNMTATVVGSTITVVCTLACTGAVVFQSGAAQPPTGVARSASEPAAPEHKHKSKKD